MLGVCTCSNNTKILYARETGDRSSPSFRLRERATHDLKWVNSLSREPHRRQLIHTPNSRVDCITGATDGKTCSSIYYYVHNIIYCYNDNIFF